MIDIEKTIKNLPEHIFKSYDIRGIAESELTDEVAYIIGLSYATHLVRKKIYSCVIGRDCRLSSERISNAVKSALVESGIDIYDIGMTLSPIAYFAQYHLKTKGLIMITASHNPKEYNGMKLGNGYSDTLMASEIQDLKNIIKTKSFIKNPNTDFGRVQTIDIKDEYYKTILGYSDKIEKYKIVVDGCGATAGAFLPELLRKAGCEVIEQNTEPNGNFLAGNPDPTETHVLERIRDRVLKEDADFGLGFDCDGDRMGLVDNSGKIVNNDRLLTIFALDALELNPKSRIVYNTLCSKLVREAVENSNGIPIIWKTGHSNIKAKLREERAIFGGEPSGHFFFMDSFFGHDDSAIAAMRLLGYLSRKSQPLSEMIDSLPKYISSPAVYVGVNQDKKVEVLNEYVIPKVKNFFSEDEIIEISDLDGIRVDTIDSMVTFRLSNTNPQLSFLFESKTEEGYTKLKTMIREMLKSSDDIDITVGSNLESLG